MTKSNDPAQTGMTLPAQPDSDLLKERGERSTLKLPPKRKDEHLIQRGTHEPDTGRTKTHAK
jgi:hypothetical protein